MDRPEKPFVIRVRQSAIDDPEFQLGIVRLSTDEHVRFMNRALREMVGDEIQVGTSLSSLSFDTESRDNLRMALEQRFQEQRGTSYQVRLTRIEAGTRVRVRVFAVPEYDADGLLAGSIGFLVDESVDAATMAIHRAIQQSPDPSSLLNILVEQLHDVIHFDSVMVTGISKDRKHLQRLYESPRPPKDILPTKWWPMRPFVKAMFDEFKPGPLDLDELFQRPDFAEYERSDTAVQQFRKRGFRFSLRLGVYRAGQLVATVSLMRRRPVPFNDADLARCLRLPIVEALNTAITLEQHRHMQFALDLINDIAEVADSISDVAQRLVNRLASHYGWEHVSLFRVDEDRRKLRVLCQSGEPGHRLPDDYEQSMSIGLVGKAYTEASAVNEGDVLSPALAGIYRCGIEGTRSELVLPVPGSKLRWLLNIESSLRDAFADEEQSSVELLLRVAGFILDRTATLELKSAILRSVADAVIQTDSLGVIQEANPAAERLLGQALAQLQHRNLANFIGSHPDERLDEEGAGSAWQTTQTAVGERDIGAMLVQAGDWPSTALEMVRADGTLVPVRVSAATLPSEHGGKVFIASDLTNQERVKHMEVLKQVFRQVASEIRLPLALAATFLKDALEDSGDVHQLVDKSLKQIRKADLPLERVIRLAVASDDTPLPRVVFDLRAALGDMVGELPQGDATSVRIVPPDGIVLVRAARHELMFCIQSLVAHLLRGKSQVEHVGIRVRQYASWVVVAMGLGTEAALSHGSGSGPAGDLGHELSLAQPLIDSLMHRMGGSLAVLGHQGLRFRLVMVSGESNDEMPTDRA